MTCLKNRQEYNPEKHGNVFDWIVGESRRLRYWQRPQEVPPPQRAPLRLLHGHYSGNSLYRLQPDVAGADKALENVFELASARKL